MSELSLQLHPAVKSTRKMIDHFSDFLKISIIDPSNIETTQANTYKKVWNQREQYYHANAPHLLEEYERRQESQLDHRGIIFAVSSSPDKILASLRLMQRPFEIEEYEYSNLNFNDFNDYWEVSRLVTAPELDHISLALIVQYLLCCAGLELFSSKRCRGLVGICKPFNTKFFSKFGLTEVQDIYCQNRNLNYKMLQGNLTDILNSTARTIKFESKVRHRLTYLAN